MNNLPAQATCEADLIDGKGDHKGDLSTYPLIRGAQNMEWLAIVLCDAHKLQNTKEKTDE